MLSATHEESAPWLDREPAGYSNLAEAAGLEALLDEIARSNDRLTDRSCNVGFYVTFSVPLHEVAAQLGTGVWMTVERYVKAPHPLLNWLVEGSAMTNSSAIQRQGVQLASQEPVMHVLDLDTPEKLRAAWEAAQRLAWG